MLKMFHRHTEGGGSAAFWEEFGSDGSFDDRLRFCETDPLRPLFERYAPAGSRMLEGGCGRGQYVAYYAARGVKVVGLDFAREWLRRLRARDPQLNLCVGDVGALPYRDGAFDVYYSGGVVEHFEAGCERSLEEAARVLKPGGVLLISVPYFSPMRRILVWLGRDDWQRVSRPRADAPTAGLRFFQYAYTPAEFTGMLEAAGLRVIGTQGYAVLWGLHDVPAFQRIVGRLAATKPAAAPVASADSGAGTGVRSAPPAPSGVRHVLKRMVVAEDDTLPVGGWLVRLGRWACANMMMYVCVREPGR
jgi:SAM-dependent methyltransferase